MGNKPVIRRQIMLSLKWSISNFRKNGTCQGMGGRKKESSYSKDMSFTDLQDETF